MLCLTKCAPILFYFEKKEEKNEINWIQQALHYTSSPFSTLFFNEILMLFVASATFYAKSSLIHSRM